LEWKIFIVSFFVIKVETQEKPWITAQEVAVASPAVEEPWKYTPNLVALLCWVFAPLPIFVIKVFAAMKNDEFVAYHKKQSFVFGLVNLILLIPLLLVFIPGIGWILAGLVWLLLMVMLFGRFYYAYCAYHGESPAIPVIGSISRLIP
jgi:uncharacterized membrane protein